MNKICVLLSTLILSGCSVGKYDYDRETLNKADMNFVGVPTVLGFGIMGSSIPITPEYSLTAAHVAKFMMYKVKAYHPTCDLALIYHKSNEKNYPVLRNSVIGEDIHMYGYSYLSAMPVSSTGTTLANTTVVSTWNKKECSLVATNAGVVQGMSGGPVYNKSDNTLAGVVEGYASSLQSVQNPKKETHRNVSLYVPYSRFKEWLNKELNTK